MGTYIFNEHRKNGVELHMNKLVTEITGDSESAKQVILNDGTKLDADLVIVGAGVKP